MIGAPYSNDSTSKEAAEQIAPVASTLRELVFNTIRAAGAEGKCSHELEDELKLKGSTLHPRVWELRLAGKITDSGHRRLTPAGRKAIVWVAV